MFYCGGYEKNNLPILRLVADVAGSPKWFG